MMKKLILSIMLITFVSGQTLKLANAESLYGGRKVSGFEHIVPNPIMLKAVQEMVVRIEYLEAQVGSQAEPSSLDLVYAELNLIILEAPDWFYKTPREECIRFVEAIVQSLKDGDVSSAINIIDFLILNQAKYFYKSYNRRPITVARFESLKVQLEA